MQRGEFSIGADMSLLVCVSATKAESAREEHLVHDLGETLTSA